MGGAGGQPRRAARPRPAQGGGRAGRRGGARGGGAEEVAARQRQRGPSARRDGQREEARDAGRAGTVSPCCLVMMPHVEAGHTVSIFQSTSTRENDRFS